MSNFTVTEFDTIVSIYKVSAIDKRDAINKVAYGDLIKRAMWRANGFSKDEVKKKYRAKEIINGKEKKKIIERVD